ncbi:PilN domain-containing protein [Dethiobacter alkaliphilus]|uniref:Fimbrial assembly family protein n=1 Tax=Dethiobacter alkaliphilus AHT 1 TaxID=555088 RepID=C0GE59_DETAL|nr:PilN domain-containing protein [Dethiobacter alkaliphilus]EEG78353.1 Fimbrial assembly family protein [Dethiobacter alkaliphilus AHT 1]
MIKINLLPPEIVEERKRKAVHRKILSVVVAVVVALALGFGVLFAATLQVRNDIQALETERAAVEAEVATYQPYVQLQNQVNNKNELLQSAMGTQVKWRETLGSLGLHIPDNVWLNNVSLSMGDEEGTLLVRGETFDHPSTAGWITALSEMPGIADVRTSFSAEEGEEFVRFEMRAVVDAVELFDPLAERGE